MHRLLKPADYVRMPWKNGGGQTTEIAVHPPGAALAEFDWRISLADVASDGPFSRFPGVDRVHVLIAGAGIAPGPQGCHAVELRAAFEPYAFSGDDEIGCTLVEGPVRDFNLMVRRGRAQGKVVVVRDAAVRIAPARWRACHAAAGAIECLIPGHPPVSVVQDDTVVFEEDGEAAGARSRSIRCPRAPWRWWRSSSPCLEAVRIGGAAARRLGGRRADRRRRRRNDRAREREARTGRRGAGVRSARARHAQSALARVPARARRAHGQGGPRGRQLLDVASGDVRVSRPRRRRCVRGDRGAGLRRDAEGRATRRSPNSTTFTTIPRESPMRIPPSSRSASSPRQPTPASRSRCCRCSTRTADSAARRPRRRSGASSTRSIRSRVSSPTLARDAAARGVTLGVAPHSLRAVTPDELRAVVALAAADAPIHIHAAEQVREVADCVAWFGARPVEWLLDHANLDARWCVVHATHMTPRGDLAARRASGAVAGLAPTTEADLGDGTFPARAYLDAAGAFGVGSDSNTIVDPFAELRQLEWSQRLAVLERNVLACARRASRAVRSTRGRRTGGARALGAAGRRRSPRARAPTSSCSTSTTLRSPKPRATTVLDAAIFGPCRRPVRDVMVGRPLGGSRRPASARGRDLRALSQSDGGHRLERVRTMNAQRARSRDPRTRISRRWRGGAPYGAIRDGAIGIAERPHRVDRAGARPSARAPCLAHARRGRPLDHAGARRLPHAPRLCRQSRGRIRGAAERRDLCGYFASGRRHRVDRARDARRLD